MIMPQIPIVLDLARAAEIIDQLDLTENGDTPTAVRDALQRATELIQRAMDDIQATLVANKLIKRTGDTEADIIRPGGHSL